MLRPMAIRLAVVIAATLAVAASSFAAPPAHRAVAPAFFSPTFLCSSPDEFDLSEYDPADFVSLRMVVGGDLGGYSRSCIRNEAGRFRGLDGNMSDTDAETGTAEINVEGKKVKVEGFKRWMERGDVGLNQRFAVTEAAYGPATGLFDGFYMNVTPE
eukprot:CAMPEP_0194307522 /NCGR_PEP_ID=MMETSP0171-20130528/4428_1 /TAXON_ID=218684 /ORGANISM="Corethron pennatum, Strain L29A3" /LENGTH=156 /DNA_ID=CAMNT_0039059645 /DNA_START=110 /DNA_END=580 /DNA_ORIENTATION=+